MINHSIRADAPVEQVEDHPVDEPARTTYRRLRMAGLDATQAGNLTAHLAGIRATPKGWTLHEVESLLFVRSLVASGKLQS